MLSQKRQSIFLEITGEAGGGGEAVSLGQDYLVRQIPVNDNNGTAYKSWSLFLVCNPEWVNNIRSNEIPYLRKNFMSFATAIGQHNLAVWFRSNETNVGEINIDFDACATLCEAYHLDPAKSPHILVTTKHPKEILAQDGTVSYTAISLANLNTNQTLKLLKGITYDVQKQRISQRDVDSEIYWRSWLSTMDDLTSTIGNIINQVTIKSPYFEVSFQGE